MHRNRREGLDVQRVEHRDGGDVPALLEELAGAEHALRHHAGDGRDDAAAGEQLTHKQVQRARKGRQLTLRMMMKLTRILNEVIPANLPEEKRKGFTPYLHRDLFTYAKGYDAGRADPNAEILESA